MRHLKEVRPPRVVCQTRLRGDRGVQADFGTSTYYGVTAARLMERMHEHGKPRKSLTSYVMFNVVSYVCSNIAERDYDG